MPRTNVHCLIPSPPKRPVDVKRGDVNMSTAPYISWLNKLPSKGQIGSTCMEPLASEITFAKKKITSRSKTTLVLARIEF